MIRRMAQGEGFVVIDRPKELASGEASYVTGYSFFADGGLSIDAAR